MSAAPTIGLYASRAFASAERIAAGAAFALDSPVEDGGSMLFRRSLWLPVPAACAGAVALRLAGALALRFAPASFTVETGRDDWFTRVETTGNRNVRLDFVWPATVSRIESPFGHGGIDFTLHRVDGERVIDEASQSGRQGTTLSPPWVGSPVVVRLAHAVSPLAKKKALKLPKAQARAGGGSAIGVLDESIVDIGASVLIHPVVQSDVVPAITVAGAPTSPRLLLHLEARGDEPEKLLWQALLPGEQATVTLPAQPLATEWAAALEQVLKALAASEPPAVLRLDLESDAPCTVSLTQASLVLEADRDALAAPVRLDFDGSRRETRNIALALPATGAVQAVALAGRLDGGTDAPAPGDALPGGGRYALLLDTERAAVRRVPLAAPTALAGVALPWHPLSDRIAGTLRLLPDGGPGPGTAPLLELAFTLETPQPARLALRWPPLDVQPQALWLQVSLAEGRGLWLADPDEAPAGGWSDGPGGRQPLALAPLASWLVSAAGSPPAAPVELSVADIAVAPQIDGSAWTATVDGAAAATAPASGIDVGAASRVTLVVERALATVRLP